MSPRLISSSHQKSPSWATARVDSTLFYAYHLFNSAFRFLQMGYASALGWFLFLVVFALTILQLKLSKRWVHYEA